MNFAEPSNCYKAETDLFTIQPFQTNVDEGSWHSVAPGSNFQSGTIEFNVAATDEYIDLSQTELYLKVSIRKRGEDDISANYIINGKPFNAQTSVKNLAALPESSDMIGPVNNFFHSIFNQVILTLNNDQIENSNGSYAYRAYLENLLNYGKGAKDTHLISSMFIKDTAGNMESTKFGYELADFDDQYEYTETALNDTMQVADNKPLTKSSRLKADANDRMNFGLINRRARFVSSQSVEMTGPLHIDLFNTNKYLMNKIPFKLSLQRSKDDFSLMGDMNNNPYTVMVDKAVLYLRKVKIAPSIMDNHIVNLQTNNAQYPIRRVVVKTHLIPNAVESFMINNIYTGKMPRRVVVGLVDHTASNGNIKLNPFNFHHFDLQSIKLTVAGHALPYRDEIELDFKNDNYLRGYNTLFKGINGSAYENGNDITYNDYKNGYALYAYNLTPDMCDSEHFSIPKTGDLQIDLKFSERTPKNINAIIYLEFDGLVQITNLRQIKTSYKV